MPTKLKCNDLIRGSFIAKDDRSIRISVPTKNGSRTFQIEEADLGINVEDTDFVEQQGVMAKVASIGKNARLSAKFNDVFDYTVEVIKVQLLVNFLKHTASCVVCSVVTFIPGLSKCIFFSVFFLN